MDNLEKMTQVAISYRDKVGELTNEKFELVRQIEQLKALLAKKRSGRATYTIGVETRKLDLES